MSLLAVAPLERSSVQMAVLRLSLLQSYFKPSWWVGAVRERGGLAQVRSVIPSSPAPTKGVSPAILIPTCPSLPHFWCTLQSLRDKNQAKQVKWLRSTGVKRPIPYQFSPLDPKPFVYKIPFVYLRYTKLTKMEMLSVWKWKLCSWGTVGKTNSPSPLVRFSGNCLRF